MTGKFKNVYIVYTEFGLHSILRKLRWFSIRISIIHYVKLHWFKEDLEVNSKNGNKVEEGKGRVLGVLY